MIYLLIQYQIKAITANKTLKKTWFYCCNWSCGWIKNATFQTLRPWSNVACCLIPLMCSFFNHLKYVHFLFLVKFFLHPSISERRMCEAMLWVLELCEHPPLHASDNGCDEVCEKLSMFKHGLNIDVNSLASVLICNCSCEVLF